ncbi:hypothetical protein SELMODRAFT_416929 [Selaginella moellendorffii]|uniref:SET domain-containing protein n=1 Tax=Selaginella moellendorffii TaxID=88036 RepID=D8S0U6_SELML|nr:hypothetical protein SELMODRAFT_416929 [Selaginella moellendorffii]
MQRILEDRGLKLRFPKPSKEKCQWLEEALEAARILELNETECYFLEDDESGMISARNEMASFDLCCNVGNFAAPCERNAEKSLSEWAKDRGVKSNIDIADFEGYGRGGAAACDLKAGDLVLDIPSEIIISETVTLECGTPYSCLQASPCCPGFHEGFCGPAQNFSSLCWGLDFVRFRFGGQ